MAITPRYEMKVKRASMRSFAPIVRRLEAQGYYTAQQGIRERGGMFQLLCRRRKRAR